MIIGHRGASALAPENTLAAFRRAMDDGAHGIELDVRLARDGVPVVIHDSTLLRTALTSGEVARLSSKQLGKVNVGSWFNHAHPAAARIEYERESIPKLTDVFQLLHKRPGVVYVELKTESNTAGELARAVNAAISESSFQQRAIVISFDLAALSVIKKASSSIRTGALFAPRRRPALGWRSKAMLSAARECGADELLPHRLLARSRLAEQAAAQNLPVVVWTVAHRSWVARAKKLGIHGLMTNDPVRLLND